jgi:hypothetical protein
MPNTDFDFVHGSWAVLNRRRRDALDPTATEWDEFASTGTHTPLAGGMGNLEAYETTEFPGIGRFTGLALRLYEPATDVWRIYWSSSAAPGKLDPPLVGGFDGRQGTFLSRDVVNGTAVDVRFVWQNVDDTTATWEQAFSTDGGTTWDTNWVMEMSRIS